MKIAFSSLGCPEVPVGDLPALAAEYGFGGVELRGTAGEHVHPSMSAAERREVLTAFKNAGVAVSGVTAYTRFGTSDPEALESQIEELVSFARLAADLESPFVRTFIGGGSAIGDARDSYDAAALALMTAAQKCEPLGVRVLVETHDTVSSTAETMDLLDRARHSNLGVLWDIAHTLRAGESLEEGWARVKQRVGYFHLKDERPLPDGGIDFRLPGDGIIPFGAIRDLTLGDGFKGWYCLEWERKWHPEIPPLPQALKAFRAVMTGEPGA